MYTSKSESAVVVYLDNSFEVNGVSLISASAYESQFPKNITLHSLSRHNTEESCFYKVPKDDVLSNNATHKIL